MCVCTGIAFIHGYVQFKQFSLLQLVLARLQNTIYLDVKIYFVKKFCVFRVHVCTLHVLLL